MQNKQNLQNNGQAPLVTFIVTYYNLPVQMLCQCLDSIMALSLNRSEREVIVIDDGSDDSPLSKLDAYKDDVIYVRQPNAGLSEARNRGIVMASGQYLQFVDADDYLVKAPYEHCIDIVRQKQPEVVLFDFTDNDESATADFTTEDMRSGAEYLAHSNLKATACCYLFKRTILGMLRFTPGIFHEDEEFTPLLLLRAETIYSSDAKAYFYRKRSSSITNDTNLRRTVKRLNDSLQVIDKLSMMADVMPPNERMALQRRVAQLTMDYIYNIIMQTRNRHYLERKLIVLRRKGLFPLPDRNYSKKYVWFRRLTNTSLGLKLLMNVLPMIKKER